MGLARPKATFESDIKFDVNSLEKNKRTIFVEQVGTNMWRHANIVQ